MNVRFLETARMELDDSVDYYNRQLEGLGLEFLKEVLKTIDLVLLYPLAWPQLTSRTRRCRINRFPFGIIYQVREDEILVVAVAHLHRKPDYWNVRI